VADTALVTGGAGFIGSHLGELLLDERREVYALDDLSTGSDANVFHLKGNPYFHNLGSTEAVTILELAEGVAPTVELDEILRQVIEDVQSRKLDRVV
jgi:UDP-glucose 4-epimerase